MDEHRPRGSATGIGRKVDHATGGLLGDNKLQAGGKMDQASGQLQNAYGPADGCCLRSRLHRSHHGAAFSAGTSAGRSRSARAA